MELTLQLKGIKPKGQLLKWIGNKYRYAEIITSYFPKEFNRYIEPFVGTGAILATLKPARAIAGDTLRPLIEFWQVLQDDSKKLVRYYEKQYEKYVEDRDVTYKKIRDNFNKHPNPYDLLMISRTCYGGVIRFTKGGTLSTPIGIHKPISPKSFEERVLEWEGRIVNTEFLNESYETSMNLAKEGDVVYCDPPYIDSQSILYGSQDFDFANLVKMIGKCKEHGAKVALSIDGIKKSGRTEIATGIPPKLFERELFLDCGSSMLRRFQNGGSTMLGENVRDRLLLTW